MKLVAFSVLSLLGTRARSESVNVELDPAARPNVIVDQNFWKDQPLQDASLKGFSNLFTDGENGHCHGYTMTCLTALDQHLPYQGEVAVSTVQSISRDVRRLSQVGTTRFSKSDKRLMSSISDKQKSQYLPANYSLCTTTLKSLVEQAGPSHYMLAGVLHGALDGVDVIGQHSLGLVINNQNQVKVFDVAQPQFETAFMSKKEFNQMHDIYYSDVVVSFSPFCTSSNTFDFEGYSPHELGLVLSSSLSHNRFTTELGDYLVEQGADVHASISDLASPMYAAVISGKLQGVQFLLNEGVDPNDAVDKLGQTALYLASYLGKSKLIVALAKAKASVDKGIARLGNSPLMIASQHGRLKSVKKLLALKADVNKQTKNGETALMTASQRKSRSKIVKALLGANADPSLKNSDGAGALYLAAQEGQVKNIKALLKVSANPDIQTVDQTTPLNIAAQNNQTKAVSELVRAKAELNLPNKGGSSPLLMASYLGHIDVVKALGEAKADINQAENRGYRPIHAAMSSKHSQVLMYLQSQGASL